MKEVEFNNIKFYIGQSAKENWDLLDKTINKSYIWFHLNSFPSPYVIMYTSLEDLEKIDISNSYLYYGANLCKENSKYKFLKNLKIIYTPVKNLSKTSIIGEVLIKGKKNFIKI